MTADRAKALRVGEVVIATGIPASIAELYGIFRGDRVKVSAKPIVCDKGYVRVPIRTEDNSFTALTVQPHMIEISG